MLELPSMFSATTKQPTTLTTFTSCMSIFTISQKTSVPDYKSYHVFEGVEELLEPLICQQNLGIENSDVYIICPDKYFTWKEPDNSGEFLVKLKLYLREFRDCHRHITDVASCDVPNKGMDQKRFCKLQRNNDCSKSNNEKYEGEPKVKTTPTVKEIIRVYI